MKEFNDYCFTYSSMYGEHFDNEEDWLEFLSPEILEAYNEYTTYKNDKENNQ